MNSQQVLIITGMHRSGTSLVSHILQQAGLNVGDNLHPAGMTNPRGYFEDVDFVNFHEQILQTRQRDTLIAEDFVFTPSPTEVTAAKHLIAQRQHRPLWGWKDPRTCLFLPFWHELLPQANYLFIIRHPLDVVLSLFRRAYPTLAIDPLSGLQTWLFYNSAILDFGRQYPDRCMICNIAAITANIPDFINTLNDRFDLSLQSNGLAELYHQAELNQPVRPQEAGIILAKLLPEVTQVYQLLEDMACLASPIVSVEPQPELTEILAQFARFVSALPNLPGMTNPLLLVLINLLDAAAVETGRVERLNYLRELERGKAWLEEQTHTWQETAQQQVAQVKELQAWIAELERGKAWLQEQNHTWQATAQQQASRINELESSLEPIHQSRIWRLVQKFLNMKTKI